MFQILRSRGRVFGRLMVNWMRFILFAAIWGDSAALHKAKSLGKYFSRYSHRHHRHRFSSGGSGQLRPAVAPQVVCRTSFR
uniref:Putative secreted protein n=1 Tax=Anopheles marajoara TaxID=58244 RepID=A0A2M4CBF3_9DIPT